MTCKIYAPAPPVWPCCCIPPWRPPTFWTAQRSLSRACDHEAPAGPGRWPPPTRPGRWIRPTHVRRGTSWFSTWRTGDTCSSWRDVCIRSPIGWARFSRLVTFSAHGQPLMLPGGGDTWRGRFRAAVPAINPENGEVTGSLSFTLEQGLAGSSVSRPA